MFDRVKKIFCGKVVKHEIFIGRNYTENKKNKTWKKKQINDAIKKHIGDCTMFDCRGVWHGEAEESVYIVVIGPRADEKRLIAAAKILCNELRQQAIIVNGTEIKAN